MDMDFSVLQALERESILEVLKKDKLLRTIEDDRIRRMKYELQELRRKGAKSFCSQYGERTCARCQRPLGKFWNSGAICHSCSHRICSKCRIGVGGRGGLDWKCTVCHAYRGVRIRSGEWFLEERAKKFPAASDRYKTVGETLLKTYSVLSYISVVPPTPPPHMDYQFLNRSRDSKKLKPFTKSVEDLMISFTSRVKKISMSQNDLRGDLLRVDNSRRGSGFSRQKSLSDTDINKSSSKLIKVPSLPNLLKKSRDSHQDGSSSEAEEETSFSTEYSGGTKVRAGIKNTGERSPERQWRTRNLERQGSISSMSTGCTLFDSSSVTGELEVALSYNTNTSCLEIRVRACRNLTYGHTKKKKCHPYVKMYLVQQKSHSGKLKTTVKRNTTDPVYNEVFKYHNECHVLQTKTLQASVWHSGTLKRDVFLAGRDTRRRSRGGQLTAPR
ncbi:synaptotagmin-like protein 3 isoform X2 [Genypterus blacodes]|uniref:synaptotagmin-like protein 3 isoform X2 n=1 Tax=Genypterus blacodes TaxID=154954 RepID=UPI003F75DAAF